MLPTRGVGTMGDSDMVDFLSKSKAGVLCLVDGDRPYAVPLEHCYRDGCLYFATGAKDDSRKLNCIRRNSRACYVIYESRREQPRMVKEGRMCRSVIVEGTVTPAAVKEVELEAREAKAVGTRKVKLQVLKMDIEKIGNWVCPVSLESCDLSQQWYTKYPDILKL